MLKCGNVEMKKTTNGNRAAARARKGYSYEILVNKKVVWKGLRPSPVFKKICEKHPEDEIAVRWKGRKGVLIA